MSKAKLIGIGGVSCAGKTTLVEKLREKLADDIKTVSFDDYYIRTKDLQDKNTDWESPDHFRYNDFVFDLEKLRGNAEGMIIVEGFLIFSDPRARVCFDKIIYLDLPEDVIVERRLDRKRGTESDTSEYVHHQLIPGQRKYVYPQKKYADLILDGQEPIDKNAEEIIGLISG